jgi:hypothetical protein
MGTGRSARLRALRRGSLVWAFRRASLGLIGSGRISGSSSCSWQSIIIGIRHPPCSSSLTSSAQLSWRMHATTCCSRSPAAAAGRPGPHSPKISLVHRGCQNRRSPTSRCRKPLGSIRWAVCDPIDERGEKPVLQVTKPRLSRSHFLLAIWPTDMENGIFQRSYLLTEF